MAAHKRNPQALIAILRDPRRSRATHDEAVRLLGRAGADILPDLVELLADPDAGVRGRAAAALGAAGSKAIAPLREALDHDEAGVRAGAVLALGLTGRARAVRPLLPVLAADPDEIVRRKAAVALGWLANDYAEDALTAASEDDVSEAVRAAARDALAKIAAAARW